MRTPFPFSASMYQRVERLRESMSLRRNITIQMPPPQKKIFVNQLIFPVFFLSTSQRQYETEVYFNSIKGYTDPICEFKGTVAPDYTSLKEARLDRGW